MGMLRTRMEQDLLVRGRSAKTRDGYLRVVADLAKHYRRPPDQLSEREVKQYLVHLIEARKLAWSSCRVAVCALRFFYENHTRPSPRRVYGALAEGRTEAARDSQSRRGGAPAGERGQSQASHLY